MTGLERIAQVRAAHIGRWTDDHDDAHDQFEMSQAAKCYLDAAIVTVRDVQNPETWPWPPPFPDDPTQNDPITNLAKAGALIAAEIDRLLRK